MDPTSIGCLSSVVSMPRVEGVEASHNHCAPQATRMFSCVGTDTSMERALRLCLTADAFSMFKIVESSFYEFEAFLRRAACAIVRHHVLSPDARVGSYDYMLHAWG